MKIPSAMLKKPSECHSWLQYYASPPAASRRNQWRRRRSSRNWNDRTTPSPEAGPCPEAG